MLHTQTPLGRLGRALRAAAEAFPHRVIGSENGPYLTRYELGRFREWTLLLHQFHRGDDDADCHDHPWALGVSLMLAGGYVETRLGRYGYLWQRVVRPGMINVIAADTFHRVDLIDPAAGAWTLFLIGPKVKSWGFRNHATGMIEPWKDRFARRGLAAP